MKKSILLGICFCIAACSAPQGKKVAMTGGVLPDVAVGPSEKLSAIGLNERGSTIALNTNKTLSVTLPSSGRDGYEWRFSEIPDPTVLKMVSKEFTPNADRQKVGEQTMVFQGMGEGEVELKMWYGTLWASPMEDARIYTVGVSVSPEPVAKPSKKAKSKKHVTKT